MQSDIDWEVLTSQLEKCARGSYQRDLLDGSEMWSGASLRGKARDYAGRYATSRENLLERMNRSLQDSGSELVVGTRLVRVSGRQVRRLVVLDAIGRFWDYAIREELPSHLVGNY